MNLKSKIEYISTPHCSNPKCPQIIIGRQDIFSLAQEIAEALTPEEWTPENAPITKMQLEVMGLEHTQGYVEGRNQTIKEINRRKQQILGTNE